MQKIELEIVALSHSITKSHSYAVVLGETTGNRRLPIIIGGNEAQAIALALEKMSPQRPLTHDLTKNICDDFKITCTEVIIDNLVEGIFHAKLNCTNGEKDFLIDSRTSDALALAVRFHCPVYTYEFILDQAGIIIEDEIGATDGKRPRKKVQINDGDDYSNLTLETLNEKLKQFLGGEEYEKAILIRDEIKKREGGE